MSLLKRIFQSRPARGWILIDEEACTGCALCLDACPMGGLRLSEQANGEGVRPARFILDRCRGDAFCRRACPEPDVITVLHQEAATT